jgi:hypothetical protein
MSHLEQTEMVRARKRACQAREMLLAVVCWLHHRGEPTSVSIQNLQPGEIYRWKAPNQWRTARQSGPAGAR